MNIVFLDDMILVKGQCELLPNFNEAQIREELVSLFSTKYPYISVHDFKVPISRKILLSPMKELLKFFCKLLYSFSFACFVVEVFQFVCNIQCLK